MLSAGPAQALHDIEHMYLSSTIKANTSLSHQLCKRHFTLQLKPYQVPHVRHSHLTPSTRRRAIGFQCSMLLKVGTNQISAPLAFWHSDRLCLTCVIIALISSSFASISSRDMSELITLPSALLAPHLHTGVDGNKLTTSNYNAAHTPPAPTSPPAAIPYFYLAHHPQRDSVQLAHTTRSISRTT